MPSSVSDGTRPKASRMWLYSSGVMLCCASNCGVTTTGEGIACAEEVVVITIAFIVARYSPEATARRVWKPAIVLKCHTEPGPTDQNSPANPGADGSSFPVARRQTLCDTLRAPPSSKPGWRNWQTQRTQNPPIARSWGFDPPSRHHKIKQLQIASCRCRPRLCPKPGFPRRRG
jgi:hypothetical protein